MMMTMLIMMMMMMMMMIMMINDDDDDKKCKEISKSFALFYILEVFKPPSQLLDTQV